MKSTKTTIEQASTLIANARSVGIIAHTRPDGDTLGASIALLLSLQKLGKTVNVYCDSDIDKSFLQFNCFDNIVSSAIKQCDLLISIDCGDLGRVGKYGEAFCRHNNTLTIDHHGGQYYAKHNCLYKYASTCQIIFELLKALDVQLDIDIATSLYLGLCTDTGNFSFSSTDKNCFEMASSLIDYGVDIDKINRIMFKNVSLERAKLLGKSLSRLRMYCDNRIALLYADNDDYQQLSVNISHTDVLVAYAINIECVDVAISIAQHANNVYKVSMRSKNANVRNVCTTFGGGGHILASGCMVSGLFEDVVEKLVRAVELELC